jgi:hypothetical protein
MRKDHVVRSGKDGGKFDLYLNTRSWHSSGRKTTKIFGELAEIRTGSQLPVRRFITWVVLYGECQSSFRAWTWPIHHDFISRVTAGLLSSGLSFRCTVLSVSEAARDKSGVTCEFLVTYVLLNEQSDHISRHVRIAKKHHFEKRICNFKRDFGLMNHRWFQTRDNSVSADEHILLSYLWYLNYSIFDNLLQ